MKELCEQYWCSQLVANNDRTCGEEIAYTMAYFYDKVVDWPQSWHNTPQGSHYWVDIDEEWQDYH
jgi:hypothetical protein